MRTVVGNPRNETCQCPVVDEAQETDSCLELTIDLQSKVSF